MNRQPFYHTGGILFTAIAEIDQKLLEKVIQKAMAAEFPDIIAGTIQVEYLEAEAGDPADLM